MNSENWKQMVKKAKHYLAVGQKEIYLSGNNESDYPWELVDSCKPGGSHRLEIATDVWFYAKHASGLMFRWSFDIEPYSANGKGHYEIDTMAIRKVLKKLPSSAHLEFREYLASCADSVGRKAREWTEIANRQQETARILRRLAEH